jgi:hypothetical protein
VIVPASVRTVLLVVPVLVPAVLTEVVLALVVLVLVVAATDEVGSLDEPVHALAPTSATTASMTAAMITAPC